ncbi:MAG: CFI-box-CTERM domain-containing protein, partial [Candidatus Ratteibacteria bacterium]
MRFKIILFFYFLYSFFLFSNQIQTQYIQNPNAKPEYSKKFKISFSNIYFGKTGDFDSIIIDDCQWLYKEGFSFPYKIIKIEIDGEYDVSYVKISNFKTIEIENQLNLLKENDTKKEDKFYPGIFVECGSSVNRGKTFISVLIYPFQYNPVKNKGIFLKDGEIEVFYGEKEKIENKIKTDNFTILINATPIPEECIIITPLRYYNLAVRLKNLHENQSGIGTSVSTRIFTTEDIALLNYGGTGQPPLASFPDSLSPDGGFASRTGTGYPNRESILAPRYNDILARKILSFLLDLADAPGYENSPDPPYDGSGYFTGRNVQHILILGNTVDVPPSYYVHVGNFGNDKYDAWIPTDYFYACSGKDGLINLNPYYSVGRIPVVDTDNVLISNLTVASVDAANRRITANYGSNPGNLAGKQVRMKTGGANGRYLDISSSSYAGGILTLNFQPTAKMDGIAAGNIFDIIDTTQKYDQLDSIITKLENWVNSINSDYSYFKNISFGGNKVELAEAKWRRTSGVVNTGFVSALYWNELSSLEVINSIDKIEEGGDGNSYVAGLGVKKYFESNIDANGNKITNQQYGYLKNDIENLLKNAIGHENGIFYFSGDGKTDSISLYDANISSNELLNYPVTTKNNIFISHAFNSAVFDREIWNIGITYSFGISSLLSPACSIAYYGPVRGSLWSLIYNIDEKGILHYSQKYINELTKLVIKHYHRAKGGKVKISDIITGAQREYWTNNQSNWNISHFRTLVQFSLLGDPVLYIPPPTYPVSEYTNLPDATCQTPDRINSDNFSVYEVPDNSQRAVNVSFNSQSNSTKITLCDPRYFTADDCQTATGTGNISFTFDDKDQGKTDTTNGPGLYFLKIEQQEQGKTYYTKEIRIYFEIVNKFIPEGDILLIDDDQPRRYTTYPNDPWYQFEVMPGFPHYPDVEDFYETALQDNDIKRIDQPGGTKKYKVWHVENKDGSNSPGQGRHGEVFYDVLSNYIGAGKVVIWFCGNDWLTTLKSKEREAIQQFLNNGGKLFITGQDIGYNIGSTSFYQNVLRARYVQDNIRLYNIDGVSIDDLSGQFQDIVITGGDGAFNQYWPSEIDPGSGTSSIFLYDPAGAGGGKRNSSGSAGIKYYDQGTGGAFVYLAFGFEAINNRDGYSNGRKWVLNKILNWLTSPTPTGVFRATPGDGQVYLSWVFPNQTDTNILILYKVGTGYPTGIPQNGQTYTPGQTIGDGTVLYVGTATSYTHTGLTNGTTYYYTAYVYDTATKTYKLLGNASATPQPGGGPGPFPAPTNLIATSRWTGSIWVVDLSWQDNSTDEDGFAIERKIQGGSFVEIKRVGANVRNYTDDNNGSGLTENTTYTYRVRAYRGSEYSNYSNEASTTTTLMLPPENLQAIGGERSVYLMWESTSSNQIGFEIERKHPTPLNPNDNYNLITTVGSEARNYSDFSIYPDGRPYYYRVRAYNQTDKTDYSNEAYGVPTAFPFNENPSNLQAFGGWNSIVVRFDDNTQNESYYYIELWWKRVPSDTTLPDTYVVVKGKEFTGLVEATITETSIFQKGGRWYIRVNGLHKTTGYGFSWYAKPSPDFPNQPNIPVGLNEDQKTRYYYVWVELPEIPSGGGGGCFIASLCFGKDSWQVKLFKQFRDKILLNNYFGRKLVVFYYKNSPSIVEYLKKHKFLIIPVRIFLYFGLFFVFLVIYRIWVYIIIIGIIYLI